MRPAATPRRTAAAAASGPGQIRAAPVRAARSASRTRSASSCSPQTRTPLTARRTAGTSAPSRPASTICAPAAAAPAACPTVVTGASSTIPGSLRHGCDITDRAWHDSYVPVVFLIAIVVVLVGIFFAATGRGGELAYEQADHAPLDLGPVSAADIALLRPPTAMWGYNMQVTDAALDQIARAMRERDVTIAYLQEQLATYERNGSYAEPRGAHARQAPGTLEPDALDTPGVLGTSGFPEASGSPTNPDLLDPRATLEPPESSATLEPPEPSRSLRVPGAILTCDASGVPRDPGSPGPSDACGASRGRSHPETPRRARAPGFSRTLGRRRAARGRRPATPGSRATARPRWSSRPRGPDATIPAR